MLLLRRGKPELLEAPLRVMHEQKQAVLSITATNGTLDTFQGIAAGKGTSKLETYSFGGQRTYD